jgi:hypothetical protein
MQSLDSAIMSRSAQTMLLVLFFLIAPAIAGESKPLKVIAPDLVIESAEQGEFLDDPPDPRHFQVSNTVPHTNRRLFGWRLKANTKRQSILVQERSVDGKGKQGVPGRLKPRYGYIFHATDLVETVPPGKYSYTVFLENQPVKTFSYELK